MFPSTLSLSSNYFNNKVGSCLGAVQSRLPSSDILQTGAAEMFFTVVITAHKLSVRFITHDADGGPGLEEEITPTINTLKQFTRGNMNVLSHKYGATGGLLLQQQEKQAGSGWIIMDPCNLPHHALCFLQAILYRSNLNYIYAVFMSEFTEDRRSSCIKIKVV